MVILEVRNESAHKRLYRRDALQRLAERVYTGEGRRADTEISLLLCDDPFMKTLNRHYRKSNRPTDVLSFEQEDALSFERKPAAPPGLKVLGDIVISLETVERNSRGDRSLMRREVPLLFCHGLLHLLGHDHATARERKAMNEKQAHYLGLTTDAAWRFGPSGSPASESRSARGGGSQYVGR